MSCAGVKHEKRNSLSPSNYLLLNFCLLNENVTNKKSTSFMALIFKIEQVTCQQLIGKLSQIHVPTVKLS